MFMRFREGLHFTYIDGQLISLDLINDSYTVHSKFNTEKIIALCRENTQKKRIKNPLMGEFKLFKDVPDEKMEVLNISDEGEFEGVSVNFWHLRKNFKMKLDDLGMLFEVILILHKVHKHSDKNKINGLIQLLAHSIEKNNMKNKKENDINSLISLLDTACLFYMKKTKCLEWACALIMLGIRYGFEMKLVIGVQNRPFYAHAWVEYQDKVLGDVPNIRSKLAVIYETAYYCR